MWWWRWGPRETSTDWRVTNSGDQNPFILVMPKNLGTWSMILWYAHHRPFTVKFTNEREWQNQFNTYNKGSLVWYTDKCTTYTGTGACVCTWGIRSSIAFHTTAYDNKACVTENVEKGYTGRNMYIPSDSQAAMKALENFQMNSKSVWDCQQSTMKLAEHSTHLTTRGLTAMRWLINQPARLLTSTDCTLTCIWYICNGCQVGGSGTGWVKNMSIGTQFVDKKRLPAFLNDSLLKKSWTINQIEQKPAMQMMGLLTGHCHFKGHPLTLGLVNSPERNRCKQVQYLQQSHSFFCSSRLWSH